MTKQEAILNELLAMRSREEITPDEYSAALKIAKAVRPEESKPPQRRSDRNAQVGFLQGMKFGGLVFVGCVAIAIVAAWFEPEDQLATVNDHDQVASRAVSASAYGSDWPFPFSTAVLKCRLSEFGTTERPVVTLVGNGTEYGLNAPALASYADFSRHLPRDSFTGAYTKGFDTVKILLRRGLALCNQ